MQLWLGEMLLSTLWVKGYRLAGKEVHVPVPCRYMQSTLKVLLSATKRREVEVAVPALSNSRDSGAGVGSMGVWTVSMMTPFLSC